AVGATGRASAPEPGQRWPDAREPPRHLRPPARAKAAGGARPRRMRADPPQSRLPRRQRRLRRGRGARGAHGRLAARGLGGHGRFRAERPLRAPRPRGAGARGRGAAGGLFDAHGLGAHRPAERRLSAPPCEVAGGGHPRNRDGRWRHRYQRRHRRRAPRRRPRCRCPSGVLAPHRAFRPRRRALAAPSPAHLLARGRPRTRRPPRARGGSDALKARSCGPSITSPWACPIEGRERYDTPVSTCSTECRLQGTCANPIDLTSVATVREGEFDVLPETPFDGHRELTPPGSCNTPGRQLVFRYVPPVGGILRVGFQNAIVDPVGNPVLIVRKVCDDPESELPGMCVPHLGGITIPREVEAGVPLYFVVDSHQEKAPDFWIAIAVSLTPYKKVGEVCRGIFVNPVVTKCEPGLICGVEDVCVPNTPPSLLDAVVYRGGLSGNELVVAVEAQDDTSDLAGIVGKFFDADGNALDGGDPRSDFTSLGHLSGGTASLDDGRRSVDFFVEYPALADATEVA